jgi:ribonuclease VapC
MIVDTSAVIAIALKEPGWEALYQAAIPAVSFANAAPELLMSAGTLQELLIVALRKGVLAEVEVLLTNLDFDYVPVDRVLALKGLELYQQYGKGSGHPAQLNYGDCFAAAIATMRQIPLLYAGEDFHAAGF